MANVFIVLGSFIVGLGVVLSTRFLLDIPFPWELRRRNPNPKALAECFEKLRDDSQLDIVMGEMNKAVCIRSIDALKSALEKDVKIRIINSPRVDTRSGAFLQLLDNPKVELHIFHPRPEPHFRIVDGKEVYIEEPHRPFKDEGYRYTKSSRLINDYARIFNDLLSQSVKASIRDFQLVEPQ